MQDARFLQGRKKALALLNQKERTKWELCDRMRKAGFSQDVIEDAVAYAESFHYIDDLSYASRFAEIYCKTRSIQRIRQDLLKRHVPEEYITLALEQIQYDDSEALEKEFQKIRKQYGETISYEERQKIAAKLCRKGFQMDAVFRILDASY